MTADWQVADPERALRLLVSGGMQMRQGRSLGRTLYVQTDDEPSDDDLCVGVVDSPEIATLIVACVNEHRAER